ncbi:hypothetical protein HTVC115P_gp53 [Pelagibacter phage HTVC115P]|nr:hypothetical protein HTVC115P_gp53 [Pelagibacter phage HTVC115P]
MSPSKAECPTGVTGLCEPGVTEVIEETVTEEVTQDSTGITTITTTVTDTTTTTVTNEDSGNILDGNNGYVSSKYEGDMDIDWGGQGPASMPSGSSCGQLGTDKCAMITGSGNSTSRMGVSGMGTTFYQTISISDLEIDRGGRTNYTIKVNKSDPQDRIYMHITGKDGNTQKFAGTDILSETGVTTGYQEYSGGFDFSGGLTTLIVEVGGRDINLSVGPMFDDVTINVLYNVVNTIVTQTITSVEMFLALNIDAPEEVIDVVETIFENNEIVDETGDFNFEPIEESQDEISIETVEMEMELELDFSMDIESEMEIPMETSDTEEAPVEVQVAEIEEELEVEVEVVEEKETTETAEAKTEETKEQPKEIKKAEVKKEAKQKAANKIVKKMGDKGKYDSQNQLKTLVVMQVLGNSKDFFSTQQNLPDIEGFFTDVTLPDGTLSTNNMAQYFLFGGSNSAHNELVDMQYR